MSAVPDSPHVYRDAEAVARAAARLFVLAAQTSVRARGRFHVALAGGSTPRRTYELLASAPYCAQVPWQAVEIYFGDERAVGPEDPRSNFGMVRECLLRPVGLPASQVHRMAGEQRPLADAAMSYQRDLATGFRTPPDGPAPRFDLVLLGMGTDGHTASLFPGTAALTQWHRWVVVNDVPQLGEQRLTFTMPVLVRARRTLFMVAGKDKAAMLARVFAWSPADPLPCQSAMPERGQAMWLVDAAAASRFGRGRHR